MSNRTEAAKDKDLRADPLLRLEGMERERRRIAMYDEQKHEEVLFLTNLMSFAASPLGTIDRQRWPPKTIVTTIKQHLKIMMFAGANANTVRIQIWTAAIAMLPGTYLSLKPRYRWSITHQVALVRSNLFRHWHSWGSLHDSYGTP